MARSEESVSSVVLTVVPSRYRPGVGRLPRADGRRPMLPVHARHCAPLEAGSALGWLVYPALEDHESFQLQRAGPGELLFSFFGGDPTAPRHLFTTRYALPAGSLGVWSEQVLYVADDAAMDGLEIAAIRDAIMRMGSLWVPPGAVALRGAYDFRTPEGWDLVFTGVVNQAAPHVAALTARVETDWYAFETEFRYVLEVGEVLSGSGLAPVGQTFAVPRIDLTLEEATAEVVAAFRDAQDAFLVDKARQRHTTPEGFEFDAAYRARSHRPGP